MQLVRTLPVDDTSGRLAVYQPTMLVAHRPHIGFEPSCRHSRSTVIAWLARVNQLQRACSHRI
jgi:hypothetical protein